MQSVAINKTIQYLLTLLIIYSCNNSKWETIAGEGISDEPKSIDKAIYFENENNGVVGGFTFSRNTGATIGLSAAMMPVLYLTKDGGKNWSLINFDSTINQSIQNAYLRFDTLICQTASHVLISVNKGRNFKTVEDSAQRSLIIKNYFSNDNLPSHNEVFQFGGKKYSLKERHQNNLATVIVCKDQETLTEYYFISFNKGKSWTFLQKDFADNRRRFLLSDKFFYRYYFPLGLQRLKLK